MPGVRTSLSSFLEVSPKIPRLVAHFLPSPHEHAGSVMPNLNFRDIMVVRSMTRISSRKARARHLTKRMGQLPDAAVSVTWKEEPTNLSHW